MKKFYYLIHFQYLGFRYHGWQRQRNVKTVQEMLEKTLTFILRHDNFRVLGSSRTDAMVSVNEGAFELFTREPLDTDRLFMGLNENLPSDIKALSVEEVDAKFNIIQHPKVKEYIYLFSSGEKNHPFCAPFMTSFIQKLNVDKMKEGANYFVGKHNLKNYCYKPNENTQLEREVLECTIERNDILQANFFPEESYLLKVKGEGFMRHQVRLMMGALFLLGKDEITLEDLHSSIHNPEKKESFSYIAPASGLMLNKLDFKDMQKA